MTKKKTRPEVRHPIRVVAQRTGLTPDVLRVWEKRYGVVEPQRTATGQRLYSDRDVERLRLLREVTEAGRSIGRVSGLSVPALQALVAEDELHREATERARLATAGEGASEHVAAVLEAVRGLEAGRADARLMQSALQLGSRSFLEQVAVPLMREVGALWHSGDLGVAHEHLATASVERVLSRLLWPWSEPGQGPVVVVGTPSGQRHELGALLCAAVAFEAGWRVVYLGSDVPAAEIAGAAAQRGARLVALSVVHPARDRSVSDEIRSLGTLLGDGVGLVVGGAAAPSYLEAIREAGGQVMPDLSSLRDLLGGYRIQSPGEREPDQAEAVGRRSG